MVQNPEIGGQYWFVTDIWERFCPVPVTIVAVNEEYGALLVRWDIGESNTSSNTKAFGRTSYTKHRQTRRQNAEEETPCRVDMWKRW